MDATLLAFDLSTTVLGYSLFAEDGSFVSFSYHKFTSDELPERGEELATLLTKIVGDNPAIYEFAIEERLKSFRPGGTNADAMLKTAQLNFLCQYLVKHIHSLTLLEINVNTARSSCFPGFHKIARVRKGTKHKEIAFEMACKAIGEDKFPKKILKSGPRKGEEIFLDEAMDMADSYVIGRAAINIKNAPVKEVKEKKTTKKK